MAFDPRQTGLPVVEILTTVKEKLEKANTLIVHAPPGAGKSTVLPLALYDAPFLEGKKVLMLEPRRLAARGIAHRMASLLGEAVGETVGYRVRFDSKVSKATKIEVLTEGILTRMLQSDNALEGVGMVVFDEFHERSIHAEVAMALCREAQQILRPDLRILVMSATLDMPGLTKLLKAEAVESLGKPYPVTVNYLGQQDEAMMAELTARAITQAIRENEGDVLAFLPGQGEILRCGDLLKGQLSGIIIHYLYGQLPQRQQQAAILPDRQGKRKVVLATSIAETSLTIEGVRVVVDAGYARVSRFDPRSGLSRLITVPVSQDAADQRAGRAGRLGPGVCYRLWSRATQERLKPHRTPEILVVDLAPMALDMAQWGVEDIMGLDWLTPPPKGTLAQAQETLGNLEALEYGHITEHGQQMRTLPCHPRIAHMLLIAQEEGQASLACDVAAILEERDPLPKEEGIDINTRVEALRRLRGRKSLGRGFARIEKIAEAYRKICDAPTDNGPVDPYATGLLLARAYPERIAYARPGNNAQFQLSNGKLAMAGHRDSLAHEPWLAVAHLDARDGMGKIFMASPINPKDLAPMVKTREHIAFDIREGGVTAAQELRIGSIVLRSVPISDPDPEKVNRVILEAVKKDGERMLNFDSHVAQWQARVLCLRQWRNDEAWPDVSTPALLADPDPWLAPYLLNIRKAEALKKLNLIEILQSFLSYEQQTALEKLCPIKIEVPTGSKITLKYAPDGTSPVLAVRLQEVFGMADTPRVNDGRNPVLMHLLSPGYKPVQVTSDLQSFWNNTYFDVRKDLKGRYPKHAWPDDPKAAQAVRGVKRKS